MSELGILSPLPMVNIAGGDAPAMLLTPSPREVSLWPALTLLSIDIDLGSAAATFDALYLGGVNAPADTKTAIYECSAFGVQGPFRHIADFRLPGARGPTYQHASSFAPLTGRYWRIYIETYGAPVAFHVGYIALGTVWNHPFAYGGGRQLIDTSRRTDLIDGGFGIDPGVSKAGFRWRFVDLYAEDVDALWALTYGVGTRKPVVVLENASIFTGMPDASVHYGLFDKFEPWERANAADTVWALSMTEWK